MVRIFFNRLSQHIGESTAAAHTGTTDCSSKLAPVARAGIQSLLTAKLNAAQRKLMRLEADSLLSRPPRSTRAHHQMLPGCLQLSGRLQQYA